MVMVQWIETCLPNWYDGGRSHDRAEDPHTDGLAIRRLQMYAIGVTTHHRFARWGPRVFDSLKTMDSEYTGVKNLCSNRKLTKKLTVTQLTGTFEIAGHTRNDLARQDV